MKLNAIPAEVLMVCDDLALATVLDPAIGFHTHRSIQQNPDASDVRFNRDVFDKLVSGLTDHLLFAYNYTPIRYLELDISC